MRFKDKRLLRLWTRLKKIGRLDFVALLILKIVVISLGQASMIATVAVCLMNWIMILVALVLVTAPKVKNEGCFVQ